MPRTPRVFFPNSLQHIMARGNNKHVLFHRPEDYRYFLFLISRYKPQHAFDLYHYCLMPNHIHMLVRITDGKEFSLFMKQLNLAYFHYYNNRYTWTGHFWQDRFKSQTVGNDHYFVQCGKYIELNPLRAGLVDTLEDYPYSSFQQYATGSFSSLLTIDPYYISLAKSPTRRAELYRELLVEDFIETSRHTAIWASPQQRNTILRRIHRLQQNSAPPRTMS